MPSDDPSLPQRLAQADRVIERETLARRIRELGGFVPEPQGDEVSEVELDFFKRVIAWEEGPSSTHRDWLARRGLVFAPPGTHQGAELQRELWRMLEALAVARVFVENTGHLDDEQLYRRLWNEVLPGETSDIARTPRDACHVDLCDSAADPKAWLTYFATEDDRAYWQSEFPDETLPPQQPVPHDRDDRLPCWK